MQLFTALRYVVSNLYQTLHIYQKVAWGQNSLLCSIIHNLLDDAGCSMQKMQTKSFLSVNIRIYLFTDKGFVRPPESWRVTVSDMLQILNVWYDAFDVTFFWNWNARTLNNSYHHFKILFDCLVIFYPILICKSHFFSYHHILYVNDSTLVCDPLCNFLTILVLFWLGKRHKNEL